MAVTTGVKGTRKHVREGDRAAVPPVRLRVPHDQRVRPVRQTLEGGGVGVRREAASEVHRGSIAATAATAGRRATRPHFRRHDRIGDLAPSGPCAQIHPDGAQSSRSTARGGARAVADALQVEGNGERGCGEALRGGDVREGHVLLHVEDGDVPAVPAVTPGVLRREEVVPVLRAQVPRGQGQVGD
eukprot:587080-Prorocentrum_minimum.AAC.1